MLYTKAIKKMELKRNFRKGVTLVELVAVSAIIATLAMVAVQRYSALTEERPRVTVFEANFDVLRTAVIMYAADHGGVYPTNGTNLAPYVSEGGADPCVTLASRQKHVTYSLSDDTLTGMLTDLIGNYSDRKGTFLSGTYKLTFTP